MLHQLLIGLIPNAVIPDPWRISHVFGGGFVEVGKAATHQDALLERQLQSDLLEEPLPLFDAWPSQLMNHGSASDTTDESTLREQLAAVLLFAAVSRTCISQVRRLPCSCCSVVQVLLREWRDGINLLSPTAV